MSKREALSLMPRKSLGKVAHTTRGFEYRMPLDPILSRMADKITHDRPPQKSLTPTGRPKHGKPACKLTDAQVIEMRRRHEKECWTIERCAEHYGLTRPHAYQILQYTVRSNVGVA